MFLTKKIYKYTHISFRTIDFKQVRITANSDIGNSFQGEGKYILKKKSKEFYINIIKNWQKYYYKVFLSTTQLIVYLPFF